MRPAAFKSTTSTSASSGRRSGRTATVRHCKSRYVCSRLALGIYCSIRSFVSSRVSGNSSRTRRTLGARLRRRASNWHEAHRNLSSRKKVLWAEKTIFIHPISPVWERVWWPAPCLAPATSWPCLNIQRSWYNQQLPSSAHLRRGGMFSMIAELAVDNKYPTETDLINYSRKDAFSRARCGNKSAGKMQREKGRTLSEYPQHRPGFFPISEDAAFSKPYCGAPCREYRARCYQSPQLSGYDKSRTSYIAGVVGIGGLIFSASNIKDNQDADN